MEVKNSTFTSAAVSGGGNTPSFDMYSWQGLTKLLQMAKERKIDDETYHSFRDSVLAYAQSGGDKELKKELEAHIQKLGLTAQAEGEPVAVITQEKKTERDTNYQKTGNTPEKQQEKKILGGSRLSPMFKPIQQASFKEMPPAIQKNEKKAVEDEITVPIRDIEASAVAPPPEETSAHGASVPRAEEHAENTASPSTPTAKPLEEYRSRINEIKQSVNQAVGNPVALIDANNNIGRRYMNALLNAMKLLGARKASELDAAMDVLESAYEEVIAAGGSTAPAQVANETVPPPSKEKGEEEEVPEVTERIVEVPPLPENKDVDENSEPPSPAAEEKVSIQQKALERVVATQKTEEKPPAASEVIPSLADISVATEKEPVKNKEQEVIPENEFSANMPETGKDAALTKTEDALSHETKERLISSASENKHLIPDTDAAEMAEVVAKDDISSPEVTAALDQLLNEWKLFEGGGIFGMGPGGNEHPLYIRLSKLSMFEVLAGRYEKSTPEITQSIKDYVNSWRHEQGVSYSPSETFEHYLRRVVQRIIKRQRG